MRFLQPSLIVNDVDGEFQICLEMTGFSAISLPVILTPSSDTVIGMYVALHSSLHTIF